MKLDPYFTPADLATRLIAAATAEPRCVLDPAAGDGALLQAAQRRWPTATFHALDVDVRRVAALRASTTWSIGRCDFVSPASRRSSGVLRHLRHGVDLVLLNPPYSARGAATWRASLGGVEIRCSRAMAFVLAGLSCLADGGELICLLPVSTLASRRDSGAWDMVRKVAAADVISSFPRGTFSQGTASTVGVRITLGASSGTSGVQRSPEAAIERVHVELHRGRLPVHQARGQPGPEGAPSLRFIHTTDLTSRGLRVEKVCVAVHSSGRTFGPSVLLPRIGRPMPDKVVRWGGGPAVLSDCVYALEARSPAIADRVHSRISAAWPLLAQAYGGSCAPYLTIAELVGFLDSVGIGAAWDGAPGWLAPTST
jgi:hypothetical protein